MSYWYEDWYRPEVPVLVLIEENAIKIFESQYKHKYLPHYTQFYMVNDFLNHNEIFQSLTRVNQFE